MHRPEERLAEATTPNQSHSTMSPLQNVFPLGISVVFDLESLFLHVQLADSTHTHTDRSEERTMDTVDAGTGSMPADGMAAALRKRTLSAGDKPPLPCFRRLSLDLYDSAPTSSAALGAAAQQAPAFGADMDTHAVVLPVAPSSPTAVKLDALRLAMRQASPGSVDAVAIDSQAQAARGLSSPLVLPGSPQLSPTELIRARSRTLSRARSVSSAGAGGSTVLVKYRRFGPLAVVNNKPVLVQYQYFHLFDIAPPPADVVRPPPQQPRVRLTEYTKFRVINGVVVRYRTIHKWHSARPQRPVLRTPSVTPVGTPVLTSRNGVARVHASGTAHVYPPPPSPFKL